VKREKFINTSGSEGAANLTNLIKKARRKGVKGGIPTGFLSKGTCEARAGGGHEQENVVAKRENGLFMGGRAEVGGKKTTWGVVFSETVGADLGAQSASQVPYSKPPVKAAFPLAQTRSERAHNSYPAKLRFGNRLTSRIKRRLSDSQNDK